MKRLMIKIQDVLAEAFEKAGYDGALARVSVSNRPDLCEFQCNGAMAAAKRYKEAPMVIAQDVTAQLPEDAPFRAQIAAPGFLNLTVAPAFIAAYLNEAAADEYLGIPQAAPRKIILDYGGPNVAKPLHVGHLRSAVIGDSIKRIGRSLGHEVIGDVHLGDWGLQMGLLITEIGERYPELPYFDPDFAGEYPENAPFTIGQLEEFYPAASARSKTDEAYRDRALDATHRLQEGDPGCRALWKAIMKLSIADLKTNYGNLGVSFDLWKGESDVQEIIPGMIEEFRASGLAHLDDGALIVDVSEETDRKEIPPCIVLKSDGAALYSTTDLATIIDRMREYAPDEILYVVDKRQDLHFTQVFRTARKAGLVKEDTKLTFLGFGTMNGKDGKPFKTREGGVMRLEYLMDDIRAEMKKKIEENRNVRQEDADETAKIVSLAALKYGDLSNQATKDYIFDMEKFTSFEGNTGPYILYTIVRIKSILERYAAAGGSTEGLAINAPESDAEKKLMLSASGFGAAVEDAFEELAPHKLCQFLYEIANAFNSFYHETRILTEEDKAKQGSWIALLLFVKAVMEKGTSLLGFEAPEHM